MGRDARQKVRRRCRPAGGHHVVSRKGGPRGAGGGGKALDSEPRPGHQPSCTPRAGQRPEEGAGVLESPASSAFSGPAEQTGQAMRQNGQETHKGRGCPRVHRAEVGMAGRRGWGQREVVAAPTSKQELRAARACGQRVQLGPALLSRLSRAGVGSKHFEGSPRLGARPGTPGESSGHACRSSSRGDPPHWCLFLNFSTKRE